ncbi:nicotinamidase [Desulfuromonas soudanensis]|uniref:nicotinamidase n=1 Tax=Desulfuromonas soudanensis TaxID=1603606 RepID=A0A0M4DK66_9BACT|nr:isochorismatase family protein [Desulfuromonas soudanensis]ALC17620.1 nicotinamidase [Desulfuromonas soudanensis]
MKKIDRNTSAAFDVDAQRGFTPLCPNELPVPGGDTIVEELNAQAVFARVRVASKDCHPNKAPWIASSPAEVLTPVAGNYPNLDVKWPAHCVVGTEGNLLIPGLPGENDYDLVVGKGIDPEKHPYGACYHDLANSESTGVIEFLKENGIKPVIVGGLATEYCVHQTATQLLNAGFAVVLNLGACRGLDAQVIEKAVEGLRNLGAIVIESAAELNAA